MGQTINMITQKENIANKNFQLTQQDSFDTSFKISETVLKIMS
jgi:hypothetical protein